MDLACQCQISSRPTPIISALVIGEELPSYEDATLLAILQVSSSLDDSYTDVEVLQKSDMFLLLRGPALRSLYREFLDDPRRCGVLYNEPTKCYTRILNFWLLFLQARPDPKGPDSPVHEECRKVVLANWSRLLSKCVPGDKELICRLREFTLDLACKEDVEHVVAWLEVSLQGYHISYIYLHNVLQMDSNIPKDVLVRWRTYGFERYQYSLSYEITPVQRMVLGGIVMAAFMIIRRLIRGQ